jgi:hypothetical protein
MSRRDKERDKDHEEVEFEEEETIEKKQLNEKIKYSHDLVARVKYADNGYIILLTKEGLDGSVLDSQVKVMNSKKRSMSLVESFLFNQLLDIRKDKDGEEE